MESAQLGVFKKVENFLPQYIPHKFTRLTSVWVVFCAYITFNNWKWTFLAKEHIFTKKVTMKQIKKLIKKKENGWNYMD